MEEKKEFEEIEIEQIDLDLDHTYDVSIDISSVESFDTFNEKKDETPIDFEEISKVEGEEKISETLDSSFFKEERSIEEVSEKKDEASSEEELEEMESMISISNDELDEILSGATVKEEEASGVELEEVEEISSVSEVSQPLTTESIEMEPTIIEEAEKLPEDIFSSASESITLEGSLAKEKEKIEISEEDKLEEALKSEESTEITPEQTSEVVVLSAEEYNRIVEESQGVPIVEKPIEEVMYEPTEPEYEVKESITPSDIGISEEFGVSESGETEEFELGEFEEIPEEKVISQKVEMEGIVEEEQPLFREETEMTISSLDENLQAESLEKGLESEVGEIEEVTEIEEKEGEKFEIVDDISIELETVSEKEFSVMPEEVGIEEIKIDTTTEVSEEILGIGFEEQEAIKETSVVGEPSQTEEIEFGEQLEETAKPTAEEFSQFSEVKFEEVSEEKPLFEEETLMETPEIAEEITLGEIESGEEVSAVEERSEKIEKAIEGLSEEEKEDIRKVLLYLDKLLENLPEDKIKEFASSEYYDLYVKLFDKLNIK